MLMTVCAAIIGFACMFARSLRRNGTIADREMQHRPGRAEPNRNQHREDFVSASGRGAVIEGEGGENQLLEPMSRPPKFRRCYGISEKISEVSEKSTLRRHLCSPFVTDVFFARETHN
jgi:hypothetical protein